MTQRSWAAGRWRFGATAAAAVMVLTACTGEDSERSSRPSPQTASESPSARPSPEASSSSDPSVIPAPTAAPSFDPNARIPVGPTTPPDSFPGDDEKFLARTRGVLVARSTDAPGADSELVQVGREFCSLLSGGGAVAEKLNLYGGQRNMVEEGWTAVIIAAIETYCPQLGDGYYADRTNPPETTSNEKADLARYAIRAFKPNARLSDTRIARLADAACDRLATDPETYLANLDPRVDPLAVATAVGL